MKRILLAVSGLSPQVITETLYCLQQEQRQVQALHIITTRTGKEHILGRMLGGGTGKYYQLLDEYDIPAESIDFHPDNIHVLRDEHGLELEDIRSQQDNERLLQLCLKLTWELSRDEDTALYFLVAGGRKTMTSCLTLAAQLYGRPQDRIFHVLVTPEFEGNREFWYPPRQSVRMELTDARGEIIYKESSYAKVELVSIPFVSLRNRLSADVLGKPSTPGTMLTSLVKDKERVLTISLAGGTVAFGDVQLDMNRAHLALYTFFAELKKRCPLDGPCCRRCDSCFIPAEELFASQQRLTEIYRLVSDSKEIGEMSDTGIINLNAENFNSYKSKIKRNFERAFGNVSDSLYIGSVGRRPQTRYGIVLDRSRIIIE